MVATIALSGQSNQTISGQSFTGDTAITLSGCSNITVDDCTFTDVQSAIIAVNCSNVTVTGNRFRNLIGPIGSPGKGNFVQFNNTTGKIIGNRGVNIPGECDPEDIVSVYQSNGTAGSPIVIASNVFEGGGSSTSGSGIMLGDSGGSNILCEGNVLIDPGQVGIGIAGGTNIRVHGNRIYGSGVAGSNVGLYVWNQSGSASSGHAVRHNIVNWTNAAGSPNHSWNAGNSGTIAGWADNDWGGTFSVRRWSALAASA